MSGILDILNSEVGKKMVEGTSKQTGEPADKTSQVLTMALPVLMQAMRRNATSPQGAQSLMGALDDKHDGSILDNLESLFSGGVDREVKTDGEKILNHVLGNKKPMVQNALSQKSGVNASNIAQILQIAAPILLGLLGKEKRQKNVSSQSGLEGLLGGLLKGNTREGEQSFIESILDADGDGSIIDDVADMVLKGGNKNKNGGGLLGGLLGK